MKIIVNFIQIIIALGIYNVWILRFGKATSWRGGNATNMKEEFETYGLSGWVMAVVGFLKLLFATLLIAGVWFPLLTLPAALGMSLLMLGAITMHLKVKDPFKKALPAITLFVLSLIVALFG